MNWTYNTIWFDQIPENECHTLKCKSSKDYHHKRIHGSYFIVWNFNPKNRCFENFSAITTATYLELNLSNIINFNGISKLGQIKRLELHYCTKLESAEGLSNLNGHIEWLHINHSKKFSITKELLDLKKLKVLCLNSCSPIENLKFLKDFPELVDFRFVDTDVLDGDLTPLLEHPTLVNAGFLNKRHYNLKEKDVDNYFHKNSATEKEFIQKGGFKTFKYKILSNE